MSTSRFSILVIDDDKHYPFFMQKASDVANLPASLTWMESGEKALLQLETEPETVTPEGLPGLILLDINMPGMNGFDVLHQMREKEHLKTIPVLMLSISESPDDIKRAYQMGANAYLTKPTDFDEIRDLLEAIYRFWFLHAARADT